MKRGKTIAVSPLRLFETTLSRLNIYAKSQAHVLTFYEFCSFLQNSI